MAEREVVTRERGGSPSDSGGNLFGGIIYAIFGVLEALLVFRFFFLLLGANPASDFVDFIYSVTDPFVSPFYGIFGRVVTEGVETTAVFDPATLVAILVYALIAWVIIRIVSAGSRRSGV